MKHFLILLLLGGFTTLAQAQFSDTAALNHYLRDTIRDRRPDKLTAAQLQRGLLGLSDIMHKYNFSNSSSANNSGAAILHNNRGQDLTFDSISLFQMKLGNPEGTLANTLVYTDAGLIHFSPDYYFVMGETLNLTNKNGYYMSVNTQPMEGEEDPPNTSLSFATGFYLSGLDGFGVSHANSGPSMGLYSTVFVVSNAPLLAFHGPDDSYDYVMGANMEMSNLEGYTFKIVNGPELVLNQGGNFTIDSLTYTTLTTQEGTVLDFRDNSFSVSNDAYTYSMGSSMNMENENGFNLNITSGGSVSLGNTFMVDNVYSVNHTLSTGGSLNLNPSSFNASLETGANLALGPSSFNASLEGAAGISLSPSSLNASLETGASLSLSPSSFSASLDDGASLYLSPSSLNATLEEGASLVLSPGSLNATLQDGASLILNPGSLNATLEDGSSLILSPGSFNITLEEGEYFTFSAGSFNIYTPDFDYTMGSSMSMTNESGYSLSVVGGPTLTLNSSFNLDGINSFDYSIPGGPYYSHTPAGVTIQNETSNYIFGSSMDMGNEEGFGFQINGGASMTMTSAGLVAAALNGLSFTMADASLFSFNGGTFYMEGLKVGDFDGDNQYLKLIDSSGMYYSNTLNTSQFQTNTAIVNINTESSTGTVSRLYMNADTTALMHGIRGIHVSDSSVLFSDSINLATLNEAGLQLVLDHSVAAQFKVSGTHAVDYLVLDSNALFVNLPFTTNGAMAVKARTVPGTTTTIGNSDHIIAMDPAALSGVTITFTDPSVITDGRIIKICNYSAHACTVSATAGWVKNIDNSNLTTITANTIYDFAIINGIWRVTGISSL